MAGPSVRDARIRVEPPALELMGRPCAKRPLSPKKVRPALRPEHNPGYSGSSPKSRKVCDLLGMFLAKQEGQGKQAFLEEMLGLAQLL